MTAVMTRDGDVLDQVCRRHLGSEKYVEEVLALNPRLADLGPVYAAGVMINLPELSATPTRTVKRIRLWGAA